MWKWNKWYLAGVQKTKSDTSKWTAGNQNGITEIIKNILWSYHAYVKKLNVITKVIFNPGINTSIFHKYFCEGFNH